MCETNTEPSENPKRTRTEARRNTPAALLLPLAMFVANKSSLPKENIELEGEIGYKEAF